MNRALQPDPRERFRGSRYKTYPNLTSTTTATMARVAGDFFKFDYDTSKRQTENYVSKNLKMTEQRVTITTHWALNWQHEEYVLIKNDIWIIETVYSEPDTSTYNPTGSTKYTLELLKVVNPAGLKI